MEPVTQILSAIEKGEPRAAEQLLPLVYEELRRLANHRLTREKPGQTLQATALVHEALGSPASATSPAPSPFPNRRERSPWRAWITEWLT